MRNPIVLPVLAVALLGLAGCDFDVGDLERHSQDFHYSYPLNAGGRLAVETYNGSIEVTGWDQNTVDISGTKYAPSESALDSVAINIDHSPGSVYVRVSRPSQMFGSRGARFVIKVPRGAVLDRLTTSNGAIDASDGAGPSRFHTSNGTIEVNGLKGTLDAETSNGAIRLADIEGDASAHTSNGRIQIRGVGGRVDAVSSNGSIDVMPDRESEVRATTSNASVTVRLPDNANARVAAHTSNASIQSDFEMKMRGEISKNHVDGVIGSGGPLLDIRTTNGGIHLLRR